MPIENQTQIYSVLTDSLQSVSRERTFQSFESRENFEHIFEVLRVDGLDSKHDRMWLIFQVTVFFSGISSAQLLAYRGWLDWLVNCGTTLRSTNKKRSLLRN